jgi:hypothetical protein
MSLRPVCRACAVDLRSPSRAFCWRSIAISLSTIDEVSTPDASPDRPPSDIA